MRGERARGASPACLRSPRRRRGRASPTAARADAAAELVGLINDYRRAPPAVRRPAPADGGAARAVGPARARRAGEPERARRGAARRRLSGRGGDLDPRDRPGGRRPRRFASSPSAIAPTCSIRATRRSALRIGRQHLADHPRQAAAAGRPRRLAPRRAAASSSWSTRRGRGRGTAAASASPPRRRSSGTRRSAPPRWRTAATWPSATTSAMPIPKAARWRSAPTAAGYRWRHVGENIAAGLGEPAAVVAGWLASPGIAPTSCRPTSPRWARPSWCAPAPPAASGGPRPSAAAEPSRRAQRALRMRSSSSRISSAAPTEIALSATLNEGK